MGDEPLTNSIGEIPDTSIEIRRGLLRQLEDALKRTVITYFTSHKHPVTIDQTDADMLEELMRQTNFHNGLCLILDTPGGDAISAERIVRICNVYSGNNYEVLIARRAKSAGTIIALGASKIIMGETSAIGRIDPQIIVKEQDGDPTLFPAHVIITSYDELIEKIAISSYKDAYLQLISKYDINQIEAVRRQFKLAEDIAVQCLKNGMMKNLSEEEIKVKVAAFVTPIVTKAHSRDIFYEEAQKAGLNVELIRHDSALWKIVSDYYAQSWDFVTSEHCKLIDSVEKDYSLPWPLN
jgi:ClpP class serine protease